MVGAASPVEMGSVENVRRYTVRLIARSKTLSRDMRDVKLSDLLQR